MPYIGIDDSPLGLFITGILMFSFLFYLIYREFKTLKNKSKNREKNFEESMKEILKSGKDNQ